MLINAFDTRLQVFNNLMMEGLHLPPFMQTHTVVCKYIQAEELSRFPQVM